MRRLLNYKKQVLVYPDTNKPYTLFTDVLRYAWSALLTQEYTTLTDGKVICRQPPIT